MKDRRGFNCKCGYAFKQGDNGECKRCEEKEVFEKATGTDHESYMKANQQKREAEAREDKGSSTQTKLKVIVEKMVERGWKPTTLAYHSVDRFELDMNIIIRGAEFNDRIGKTQYRELSLPDLLCNPAAMGALFGEEYVVVEIYPWDKEKSATPAHLHHTLEAVKRIYDKSAGIEAAIDYLWEEGCK